MTVQDIANNLGTSWGFIKSIDKNYLKYKYKSIDIKDVKYIAVDEFSIKKGHKYMTVVMDLETKRIIYINEGRTKESLTPILKRFKRFSIILKAIAMDMWPAYFSAVMEYLPDTHIVFDRFHIEKNLNETISNIRKTIFRDEVDINKRKLIKGTRWLLLKNSQNLNDSKCEKERLEKALNINKPLAIAYYLKEDLKQIWFQNNISDAKKFLGSWVAKAIASGIKLMKKFAHLLLAHRTGIFNWFYYRISTGPLEGMNNKIKVLKRKAYGYRDVQYFKLKIYNLHHAKYPLL
ncbi:MAG: ISL3 family transposase [Bacteroidota bacterium]|nr:ISL3 family transposase [Bacteroidota bacterium]